MPVIPPIELTQIKTGYAARWQDLLLTVEAEHLCWRTQVEVPGRQQILYKGYRSSATHAMDSAVEFAAFHVSGPSSLGASAGRDTLCWQRHW